MQEHLAGLALRGKHATASYRLTALRDLIRWMQGEGLDDPLRLTPDQLIAHQAFLATKYRTARGQELKRTSQALRLRSIGAYYRWLELRGDIVSDPSRNLHVRVVRARTVTRDHLSLQEASALIQAQAALVTSLTAGSFRHAVAMRNLAMLCLGLATGRRRSGIMSLRTEHLDLDRQELRVEREKGRTGRLLPVVRWACDVTRLYLIQARPVLVARINTPWLFPGRPASEPIGKDAIAAAFSDMLKRTVAQNPDLDELPSKMLTWHSLRVSFALLLFNNGCSIRSVNELLLHRLLSTTALYTPQTSDDLRQVLRTAHPRA